MSIKLLESFDYGFFGDISGTAGQGRRWLTGANMTTTASGRTDRAVETGGTGATTRMWHDCGQYGLTFADGEEVYFGCAIFLPAAAGACSLIGLTVHGTSAMAHNYLAHTGSGVLVEYTGNLLGSGSATARYTSPASTLTLNDWNYIEWRLIFQTAATGTSEIRLNGTVLNSRTGITSAVVNGSSASLQLGVQGFSTQGTPHNVTVSGVRYDDIYIVIPDAESPNGFLGETYVPCLHPNGNGASSQWINSAGNSTNNYSYVDEIGINDADYVESTNDGDRDTYEHETYSVPGGYAIAGVQVTARAAYLAGSKTLHAVSRLQSGTTETKDTNTALTNVLNERHVVFPEIPGGGNWTQADLDDAQFGVEQQA